MKWRDPDGAEPVMRDGDKPFAFKNENNATKSQLAYALAWAKREIERLQIELAAANASLAEIAAAKAAADAAKLITCWICNGTAAGQDGPGTCGLCDGKGKHA